MVTSGYRLPFGAAVPEAEPGGRLERSRAVAQGGEGGEPREVFPAEGKEVRKRPVQGVALIIRIL